MRIGYGYDVHRLRRDRPMILCGTIIPSVFGPDGHSDADVALHALCDAFLGALALGDIGEHFPDTDDRYKNADSRELTTEVYSLVRERDYIIGNADITIILQSPKLRAFIPKMRESVAKILECDVDRISVKATTEERMGFTGTGEGVAASAVVLLIKDKEDY